jgi:hypothetical protein
MATGPQPLSLGLARTTDGDNIPIRVGSTGIIDGSGDPVGGGCGVKDMRVVCGRTIDGNNIPVLCDADGLLNIDWNL